MVQKTIDNSNIQLQKYAKDLKRIYEEEKAKTDQLAESHSKLSAIIDTIDSGIVVTDSNLKITSFNKEFLKLIESKSEEITGFGLESVLSSPSWSQLFQNLDSSTDSFETIVELRDKKNLILRVNSSPISAKKEKRGWLFVIYNETNLRRTNQIKDEFLSLVSHEIRTPMSVITAYMDLIVAIDQSRFSEEEVSYMDIMKNNMNRLARTVSEILDMATLSQPLAQNEMNEIDLSDLTRQIVDQRQPFLKQKLTFQKQNNIPGIIVADLKLIDTAINHIIDNSVEYSNDGDEISIKMAEKNDGVELSITDHGEGISKSEVERIFDEYYQVEEHLQRTHEGIGLGLPIVKKIMYKHSGTVEIKSAPGKGTFVSLWFPCAIKGFINISKENIKSYEDQIDEYSSSIDRYKRQVNNYAHDFNYLLKTEKEKNKKLKMMQEQMVIYADDLKSTTYSLQKNQLRVQNALMELIHRMVYSSNEDRHYLSVHMTKVSQIINHFAFAAGLTKEETRAYIAGGYLYDLGMTGIPLSIIRKNGKLDENESKIIESHTLQGIEMLSNFDLPFLQTANEMAETHHENWDGTGYPHKLKGNNIPLSGRLIAIADSYSSLISPRPWRDAYSHLDAITILKENSKKRFDPDLLETFINIKEDLLTINVL